MLASRRVRCSVRCDPVLLVPYPLLSASRQDLEFWLSSEEIGFAEADESVWDRGVVLKHVL